MLGDSNAIATVAVRDLAAATRFYEGTLGLARVASEGTEAVEYRTGGTRMLVYVSEYAGTNQATGATWIVGDQVDALVRELKSRGVTFEHYDLPDTRREGDVHLAGDTRVAWFKDPDGNIHALVNG
ncbi:MAG TPA: VOC family protein [Longimicrobiaceae bacterium]|nr:VOC family protein [Longimicrobiaceae bacterium]